MTSESSESVRRCRENMGVKGGREGLQQTGASRKVVEVSFSLQTGSFKSIPKFISALILLGPLSKQIKANLRYFMGTLE